MIRLIEWVSRTIQSRYRRAPEATSAESDQCPTGPSVHKASVRRPGSKGQCKASAQPCGGEPVLPADTGPLGSPVRPVIPFADDDRPSRDADAAVSDGQHPALSCGFLQSGPFRHEESPPSKILNSIGARANELG
jgi:hypothetical protein